MGDTHVVTGATSGIGQGIAVAIAAKARAVIAIGRNKGALEALEARFPGHVDGKAIDLLDDVAIEELASDLEHAQARLRALVHCAGVHFPAPLADARVEQLDAMYRANVRAPFLLTQRLLPALERGQGYRIFINSSVGLTPRAGVGAYSAMQHAHRALAECWRQEVNKRGIRVLNIFPGRTNTPRIERLFESEGRSFAPALLLQPEDIATLVGLAIDLPSTVELTDITGEEVILSIGAGSHHASQHAAKNGQRRRLDSAVQARRA